jgi:daunorubicin resistance ABC transporter ATP-binding subunit
MAVGRAIEAVGLERRFKGGIRAVDGVDLAVERGEVYGFLGPNGAGKSTTVRMLATLLRPTGGSARVAGHDLVRDPAAVRRSIGVALQDAAIDPYMTGRELLHLQAVLHGFPRARGRERAVELLERVDLTGAADRRVGTYSGGMRRRLDLALALVHEPEVLFLDEPTTGLDPISRLTLWEEVRRLNSESGTTVFLTTQYLEEADQLAGRVGIIDGGRLVAEGTPASLKAQVGDPSLEVTLDDPSEAGRAAEALSGLGEPRSRRRAPAGRGGDARDGRPLARRGRDRPRRDRPRPAHPRRRLRRQDRSPPGGRGGRRGGGGGRGAVPVSPTVVQTAALARRSVVGTLRTPQALFPSLFFPLVLMAIFTGSFGSAPGTIPGFPPVRGFLDFALAGAVLQGILIGGTTAGAALALDIEGGFFDRLVASPVSRTAILVGRLAGGVILALAQTVLFVGIGIAFGARVEGGAAGAAVLLLLAGLLAVAISGLGVILALRSGSAEAVQGTFPLFFALLFFSSAFFPRETMTGWFRTVADANPISYLVEAMREQIVSGVDARVTLIGLAVVVALAGLSLAGCHAAFRRRLRGPL